MFGRKRQNNAVIQTLVGDNTRIKGDLRFDGGCHIDGVVHGSVAADRDPEAFLSISEDGLVEGSVRVPRGRLNGKVQGDVYATDRVELGTTARVFGNVHYEVLEMAAGAEINGQLIHDGATPAAAVKTVLPVTENQPAGAPVQGTRSNEQTQPIARAKPVKQSG